MQKVCRGEIRRRHFPSPPRAVDWCVDWVSQTPSTPSALCAIASVVSAGRAIAAPGRTYGNATLGVSRVSEPGRCHKRGFSKIKVGGTLRRRARRTRTGSCPAVALSVPSALFRTKIIFLMKASAALDFDARAAIATMLNARFGR